MQKTSGLHRILSAPWLYAGVQRALGTAQPDLVNTYLRPSLGDRLLDIGCGTGAILDALPDVEYVGFDPSAAYIESAKTRFGDRGEFFVSGIEGVSSASVGTFDIVLAKGVVHHLDDELSRQVFALAAEVLRPGGRLVTFDPCFHAGQSPIARWIIKSDRGKGVRTADAYRTLAEAAFVNVETHLRTDLLRVPYTHIILVCSEPVPAYAKTGSTQTA